MRVALFDVVTSVAQVVPSMAQWFRSVWGIAPRGEVATASSLVVGRSSGVNISSGNVGSLNSPVLISCLRFILK